MANQRLRLYSDTQGFLYVLYRYGESYLEEISLIMYENNLNAVFTFSEAPSNYRGYQHL